MSNESDSMPAQTAEAVPFVLGTGANAANLGDVSFNVEDLVEGGLSDVKLTIIGHDIKDGGEQKASRDNPNEFYVTSDQLVLSCRIDNPDEVDKSPDDTELQWFITLPKKVDKGDGTWRRASATQNSPYGMLLASLDKVGVSATERNASNYKFSGLNDWIGMQIRRVRQTQKGQGGREYSVQIVTEAYGIDNDVRTQPEIGLAPAYFKNQPRPTAATPAANTAKEPVGAKA